MVRIALDCLLACEIGHFVCLMISIPLIGFSVTVLLVVAAHRVAMDTSFPVPDCSWLHQPSRHQLPSSSIVDEFNGELQLVYRQGYIYFPEC